MQLIGHDRCLACADSVLDGTTDTFHMKLSPLQQTHFPTFNARRGKSNIKETVSIKDMNDGYEKWKKSTSISPSNRYLGHYKSLFSSDGIEQHSSTNTFSDSIWYTFSSLTNFAIHITQPLERWKTTIAIILEKR